MRDSILPNGWKFVKIGEVLKRVRKPVEVVPTETYRQIGIRSHGKGVFYKDECTGASLGDKSVFWIEPDCFIVNIVFAWEQAVTKTTKNEVGMIASHRFPMYKPVPGKLELDYILYFFKTPFGKHLLGLASPGGAGRNKTLGQEEFAKLAIPLPPYSEQRKIAEILSTWDEAITKTEALIAALQTRKKGLMQKLLTGEVRFPGFEGEWRKGKFSEFLTLQRGFDLSVSIRKQGKVKVIASNGLVGFHNESKVNGPGVITGRSGTIGSVMYEENDYWPLNTTLYIREFKGNDPVFAYYFLQYMRLEKYSYGTGVPTLNRNEVHPVKINFPIFQEQQKIANVLQTCDLEIELYVQKLTALQQQKKGLMQRLLTGEVRV